MEVNRRKLAEEWKQRQAVLILQKTEMLGWLNVFKMANKKLERRVQSQDLVTGGDDRCSVTAGEAG